MVARPQPRSRSESEPLLTAVDVRREIERLFGSNGAATELVVTIQDEDEDEGAVDTFHELLESLRRFGGDGADLPALEVEAPSVSEIAKGLSVLSDEELQKQLLDRVLTTFGRALIEPVAAVLDRGPEGELLDRLHGVREVMLEDIAHLPLTPETRRILADDLGRLLTNDYLAMLAEHEEGTQRPRAEALAQSVLHLIGDTFHDALRRWPDHADEIAVAVSRRLSAKIELREVPALVRDQIVEGVEEFLWVETSAELMGALRSLFDGYRDLVPTPPKLERRSYREFAQACWTLVAQHG